MELLTFDQWTHDVDGKYVDVDGKYDGQCWDSFADLCIRVFGIDPINTWGGTWAGWAYAIWDQYHVNGAADSFDRIPATEPALPGDVAIWTDQHWYYPASHIAAVLADAGGNLYCMSQNSSPARPWLPGYGPEATGPNARQYLTKQGLAGYLRRKTFMPTITIPTEEDDMFTEKDRDRLEYLYETMTPGEAGRKTAGRGWLAVTEAAQSAAKSAKQVADSLLPGIAGTRKAGNVWALLGEILTAAKK